MIILDWNKNSEEILAQGHYNTKRSVNAEQTHLCQYWQEQGVDKEEAYKIWVSLESPQVVGSLNEEETWEYFNYFWVRAKHYGFNQQYRYGLTVTEYELIENLNIDLEYKNIIKTLIEYCVSFGTDNWFICRKEIWKGIVRGERAKINDKALATLMTIGQRYHLFDKKDTGQNDKVKVILYCLDTEDDKRISRKFTSLNKICSHCGKRFYGSSKSKTSLCPQCYQEDLNIRKNKR